MIRRNYAKILNNSPDKSSSFKLADAKLASIVRALILVNLIIFVCLLGFRIRYELKKLDTKAKVICQTPTETNPKSKSMITRENELPLLLNKSSAASTKRSTDAQVWFNIGGKLFNVSSASLRNYPQSVLYKKSLGPTSTIPQDEGIWFARDPRPFELILSYLVHDHVDWKSLDETSEQELIDEANFYNLTSINKKTKRSR